MVDNMTAQHSTQHLETWDSHAWVPNTGTRQVRSLRCMCGAEFVGERSHLSHRVKVCVEAVRP